VARHDVSRELRDPHSGKWSRGGAILGRMAHEVAGKHEATHAKVSAIPAGGGKNIGGHWVERKGDQYHVKLKTSTRGKRDSKVYDNPEDAARAVHTGSHASPGSETAARGVAGSGRAPAAPEAPRPSPGSTARNEKGATPGEFEPGAITQRHPMVGKTVRYNDRGDYKMGTVTHVVPKNEATGRAVDTYIIKGEDGRAVQKAEGTVHIKEAPAGGERPYQHTSEADLRAMVGRGGNLPAAQELTRRIVAAEKARTERENVGRGGVTRNTAAGVGVGKPNLAGGAAPPKTSGADLAHERFIMDKLSDGQWHDPVTESKDRTRANATLSRLEGSGKVESRISPTSQTKQWRLKTGGTTRYNGVPITSMSDAQLRNAAKKPGSPQAIKDEISRRFRQAKLKEIGHVRG